MHALVLGAGGVGGYLTDRLVEYSRATRLNNISSALALDSDADSLAQLATLDDSQRLIVGSDRIGGQTTGGDTSIAQRALTAASTDIADRLEMLPTADVDAVIICAGLGRGFGSTAPPLLSDLIETNIDRNVPIHVLATLPHPNEPRRTHRRAADALRSTAKRSDNIIVNGLAPDEMGGRAPGNTSYPERLNSRPLPDADSGAYCDAIITRTGLLLAGLGQDAPSRPDRPAHDASNPLADSHIRAAVVDGASTALDGTEISHTGLGEEPTASSLQSADEAFRHDGLSAIGYGTARTTDALEDAADIAEATANATASAFINTSFRLSIAEQAAPAVVVATGPKNHAAVQTEVAEHIASVLPTDTSTAPPVVHIPTPADESDIAVSMAFNALESSNRAQNILTHASAAASE